MIQTNDVQLFHTSATTLFDALLIARTRLQNIAAEGDIISALSQLYTRGSKDNTPVYVVFTTYVIQRRYTPR